MTSMSPTQEVLLQEMHQKLHLNRELYSMVPDFLFKSTPLIKIFKQQSKKVNFSFICRMTQQHTHINTNIWIWN